MLTLVKNNLSAAFRGGAIANTIGLDKAVNPFSNDNLTTEEEQQWFEGYMDGGLFLLELHVDECVHTVEQANMERKDKMFMYSKMLIENEHKISIGTELTLRKAALSNADKLSDQQYLKHIISKLE